MKPNILVSGGFGLLGKPLVDKLIIQNYNVFVLERKVTDRFRFLNFKPKKIIRGNFLNKKFLMKILLNNKINVVFHLASITQVRESLKNPLETYKVNINGTINFLETIRDINPKIIFIYSSSDKAYGELTGRKFYKETDPIQSIYPYDVSKTVSDMICQSYSKTYNLKVGIIRSGNVYGPGDFNLKRLIPQLIISTINKKTFEIRSNGKSTRDYIYVSDAVNAYLMLMNKLLNSSKNLRIYNVSSKYNYSVEKVINKILNKMNSLDLKIKIKNFSKQELQFRRLNYSKISKELKWKPKIDIDIGLTKTINWYKKNFKIITKYK